MVAEPRETLVEAVPDSEPREVVVPEVVAELREVLVEVLEPRFT